MRSAQASRSRPLLLAVSITVLVMSALAVVRWVLWTYGSDTGTFAQIVANVPHGFTDTTEHGSHFRFHFSPVLAVLWPIVALTRSPLSLQIVQVFLIALCAVPLYAIVENYAGKTWAIRCAVLTLIYPPLLANAFSEFHELAFYPVLALALIWAADRARWGWFTVFAIALVLIREDASLDLAIIGLALGVIGIVCRNRAGSGLLTGRPLQPKALAFAGFGLALIASGTLAIYFGVVLPHVGPWAPSHFYRYPFAQGPVQTALAIFTHPVDLIRAVATRGRLTYVLEAFVPLALLPLFTRWTWLAFPAFAGILLSSDESVWRMGMHYVLLWAPWMVLAASWALLSVAQKRSDLAALRWWRTAIGLCIVFLIAFNPMHPAHYLSKAPYQHTAGVQRALACVPARAPVAMHDEWFAHEALAYPNASVLPDAPQDFYGYLLFADDWRNGHFEKVLPAIRSAERAGDFTRVCTNGGVIVLRRVGVVKGSALGGTVQL